MHSSRIYRREFAAAFGQARASVAVHERARHECDGVNSRFDVDVSMRVHEGHFHFWRQKNLCNFSAGFVMTFFQDLARFSLPGMTRGSRQRMNRARLSIFTLAGSRSGTLETRFPLHLLGKINAPVYHCTVSWCNVGLLFR